MGGNSKKRRFCDRYDGRRIRSSDPFFDVIPHIMPNRTGSMVHFDNTIDISEIDSYIHRKRAEDIPDLRFLHIIIAAMVRTISQKPKVNRFVSGKKIYARNYIRIPVTIKRSLSEDASEEIIMPEFEPTDTLYDVVKKVNDEISKIVDTDDGNSTATAANLLHHCPGFLISFVVFIVKHLDNHGWMPRFLNKASPFHGTCFLVDLGSLGIGSVYHHLYDFGTCSSFVAFGKKEKTVNVVNGQIHEKKVVNMRVVVDERICDGFYYASSLKLMKRYMRKPYILETPPEEVFYDNEA